MNILWVENHARFSQIAAKRFLAAHQVTVVPSLSAARQALSAQSFGIVLLDYDLDDGKGDALLADIQGQSIRSKVIATSSHSEGNQKLISAGADAVCSKMEFANIEDVIRRTYGLPEAEHDF